MKFDVPPIVIDYLFNNGYEEQIIDIVMAFEKKDNTEVSDIPISPLAMKESKEKVIMSPKVYNIYREFVQRINNQQTAQEIPFILLGNRKEINGESYIIIEDIIYDIQKAISETHVSIDEETFKKLIQLKDYSIISIGHTHGNVSEERKNTTIARNIPEELKAKYEIRDTGLNISIADIWQHEAFKKLAPEKEIIQTIIMYNGDMIIIGSNEISKSSRIEVVLEDGKIITVPTGTNEKKLTR